MKMGATIPRWMAKTWLAWPAILMVRLKILTGWGMELPERSQN